jgi:uncharacterized protein
VIVDLASLGVRGRRVDSVFRAGEIDLEGEPVTLSGDVVLNSEARRVNERAEITGTIFAEAAMECTRCLTAVKRRLEIPFTTRFIGRDATSNESEKELSGEELDESIVDDGQIALKSVVREQILLAIPDQILCKEGCKGLCLKCGENLNLIDCNCADDEIDPRWAALKGLRDG